MADAELHIHVHGPVDVEALGKLVNDAVELQQANKPAEVKVPTGYRCQECWRGDGGHESSCSLSRGS